MSKETQAKRYCEGVDLDRSVLGLELALARTTRRQGSGRYGSCTQEDVCLDMLDMLGAEIDVRKLSRVESGKQEPTLSLLVQLAFVLKGSRWQSFLVEVVEKSLPPTLAEINASYEADYKRKRAEQEEQALSWLIEEYEERRDEYEDETERIIRDMFSLPTATPAPTQSAVAIDEPAGKEHEHEQD